MYKRKIRIIALCALVVCLAVAFIYWRSVGKYSFKESGFYPINGTKYNVNIGDTATLGKDERYASLQLGDMDEISGKDTCIYVNDRDAIILTSTMCIIPKPSENGLSLFKLMAFSDVQSNISNLLITRNNNQFLGNAVLLFNGDDTYIVLENATLTYGDKSVTLSPLSYVIACRDQWVQYYDYSRDNYVFDYIDQDCPVEIKMKNCDLTIEADKDRGIYNDSEFMFFTAVTYLDDFFGSVE